MTRDDKCCQRKTLQIKLIFFARLPIMFFNFLLPPSVLLLSDVKHSEHSWFVTLQRGLCLLLESPKPLTVPPVFVVHLGRGASAALGHEGGHS